MFIQRGFKKFDEEERKGSSRAMNHSSRTLRCNPMMDDSPLLFLLLRSGSRNGRAKILFTFNSERSTRKGRKTSNSSDMPSLSSVAIMSVRYGFVGLLERNLGRSMLSAKGKFGFPVAEAENSIHPINNET
jgi:hypothetical protein